MNRPVVARQATPPWGRAPMALAALVVLVAAGALVGRNGSVQVGDPDPPPELTEISRPLDVVYAFGAALEHGDPAAAASLIAEEWTQLELPGLPWRFMDRPAGRADLTQALDFYADLVELDVTDCRVQAQTLSSSSAQVLCDTYVNSAFAEVGLVAGRVIPTTYWVEDDEISGILRSHLGTPMLESYCYWAESAADATLFDTTCSLVVGPGRGKEHARLAEEYLAAGRPAPGRAYRRARTGITVVSVLLAEHNRSGAPEVLVDRSAGGADAPGVLGGRPALYEFLEWSKVVYQIDLGSCFVDGSAAPRQFGVECPGAEWSGPLVAGLTLDPVRQPVAFSIEAAAVRSMRGATPEALIASWRRFCEWAVATRPDSASVVLAEGCNPTYTTEAARALLTLLAEYAADPR